MMLWRPGVSLTESTETGGMVCTVILYSGIDQFYKSVYSRPEDKILQIGNINDNVDPDTLWKCAEAYRDKFNELYGDHCKILDMAMHLDEDTPHVHIRRVWIVQDKEGLERVNQTEALKEMDILRPDPSKPETRFNNAKITVTAGTSMAIFG